MSNATLFMIFGKIASGKSTLAEKLSAAENTVCLSEDDLLAALYGDQMTTLKDFVQFSSKLRIALAPHIVALLKSGLSVVLDFQANTPQSRGWMKELIDASGAGHELHVLSLPDALCIERLHARNAEGEHDFAATEAQFHQISKHIVHPSENEGFNLIWHDAPQ